MAEAKKTTVKVTTEVPGVTLTLTNDEARVLADVLAKISGDPRTTRRGLTEAIDIALHGAGIEYQPPIRDLGGNLCFDSGDSPF